MDSVTVIIVSSPIPSHPDTRIIDETINSIRTHLPDSEIIVCLDGVREEQEDFRKNYVEYTRRVLWRCSNEWQATPLLFEEHTHQAGMTRKALQLVKTPLILFVEHDVPLVTDEPIDQSGIVSILLDNKLDSIRLMHEAHVLEPHKYLMLDDEPIEIDGVPIIRTVQWSQRPHYARTDFYRKILDMHFSQNSNSMIEDRMYGVVYNGWVERGKVAWNEYRLGLYAPPGNMKRSLHLDGREDQPKFEDTFTE